MLQILKICQTYIFGLVKCCLYLAPCYYLNQWLLKEYSTWNVQIQIFFIQNNEIEKAIISKVTTILSREQSRFKLNAKIFLSCGLYHTRSSILILVEEENLI